MAAILNSPILNSAILESAILHKTLTQTNSIWLTWWWQPSWILPSWILPCWIQTPCFLLSDSLKNNLTPLWLWLKLIQSDSNSFILTQLDDGSHLEFHHVGLRKLHSFILTQLDDGSHLEFYHLEFGHLGFSHPSFSSHTHSHLPGLVPTICTKKTSLTLPSPPFAQKTSLIHSDSTWWWQPSWILPCWIQTLCFLLSDSLKNTLTPLWLWLKVIQSDWNLFILLNLMMAAILNLAILDSAILVFPLKLTHTCQDWFPPFAQKKLHSFILTQLDDGSHLEFHHVGFRHCHLGFRHLLIFSQIHSKTLSLYSDSDSN